MDERATLRVDVVRIEVVKRDAAGNIIETVVLDQDGEIVERDVTEADNGAH